MQKTYCIILIILIALLSSCSTKESKEVIVTGQIGGIPDGTIVHLSERNSDEPFMIDTIKNEKFQFVFQDTIVSELREMSVFIYDGKPIMYANNIWVKAPTKINIKVNAEYPYIWNIESDVTEQIEANKYLKKTEEFSKQQSPLLIEINEILSGARTEENKIKFDSIGIVMDSIRYSIEKIEIDLLEKERTYSEVWYSKLLLFSSNVYNTQDGKSPFKERIIAIYNSLTEEQKKNEKMKEIEFMLFPPKTVEIGDKLMDAAMQDVEGKTHHLSDYLGKYRLLDFWATWCGPCLAASPEMKEIAEKYKDKLTVITINSEEKDVWTRYSQENEMVGVNLHNSVGVKELDHFYKVKGIPHYVLITPDDKVIDIWAGYGKDSLHDKMKEHLKK